MLRKKNLTNFICFAVGLICHCVSASPDKSVNATITYGVDDNPFNLTESLKGTEQNFIFGEFSAKTSFNKMFYLSAKAEKSLYADDPRADQFQGSVNARINTRFKAFGEKFRFKLGGNYRVKDKTYVSKNTGLVGTFGGVSIADRYDWEQTTMDTELNHFVTKNLTLEFQYQNRSKDYEQLDVVGISDFSYIHDTYLLGLEYKASKKGRFFINAALNERVYNNKRGRDLFGDEVDGTDLVYTTHRLNLGYLYRPNKKVRWRYTYHYEERRDNVSGYYNSTKGHVALSASHQFGDYQYLTAKAKYSKFSLINQNVFDPIESEEMASDRQGLSFTLGYEWVFATLFDTNIALYSEIDYANFDSFDLIYAYESRRFSLGLRWSGF